MNKFHKENGKNELKEVHKLISDRETDRKTREQEKKDGTWTAYKEKEYNRRNEERKQKAAGMSELLKSLEKDPELEHTWEDLKKFSPENQES